MLKQQFKNLCTKMFNKHYDRFMTRLKSTRDSGQKEYANNEDNVFADFDWEADASGNTPEQVIYIFLLKHIRGMGSYIKGHRSQRESIHGRIEDAVVYLTLLDAMISTRHEERKELNLNKKNI